MKDYFTKHIAFFVLIFLFILSKIPYLTLPYYWDEAWSYIIGVQHVYEKGLHLFASTDLQAGITRAHPLLFYSFVAGFGKIFGNSILSYHSAALVISCFCLFQIYRIQEQLFNIPTALTSVVLIGFQEIFWVQSVQVLPEIMLSSFVIAALFELYQKNYIAYFIYSALAFLVKESALALLASSIAFGFYRMLIVEQNFKLKKMAIYLSPMLVFILFIFFNYITYGWFVFPEHTHMMQFDWKIILGKWDGALFSIFLDQNRRILSILLICFVSYAYWKKIQFLVPTNIILLFLLYFLAYLSFCSLNFMSTRYLMSLTILFIMIFSAVLHSVIKSQKIINSILGIFCSIQLFAMFTTTKTSDVSAAYKQAIHLNQQTAAFVDASIPIQDSIYCGFLISNYLANPSLGYVKQKHKTFFENYSNPQWIIYDKNESLLVDSSQYNLIQRFVWNSDCISIYHSTNAHRR